MPLERWPLGQASPMNVFPPLSLNPAIIASNLQGAGAAPWPLAATHLMYAPGNLAGIYAPPLTIRPTLIAGPHSTAFVVAPQLITHHPVLPTVFSPGVPRPIIPYERFPVLPANYGCVPNVQPEFKNGATCSSFDTSSKDERASSSKKHSNETKSLKSQKDKRARSKERVSLNKHEKKFSKESIDRHKLRNNASSGYRSESSTKKRAYDETFDNDKRTEHKAKILKREELHATKNSSELRSSRFRRSEGGSQNKHEKCPFENHFRASIRQEDKRLSSSTTDQILYSPDRLAEKRNISQSEFRHKPNFYRSQSPRHKPNFNRSQSSRHKPNFNRSQSPRHKPSFNRSQSPRHKLNFNRSQSPRHKQSFNRSRSPRHKSSFNRTHSPRQETIRRSSSQRSSSYSSRSESGKFEISAENGPKNRKSNERSKMPKSKDYSRAMGDTKHSKLSNRLHHKYDTHLKDNSEEEYALMNEDDDDQTEFDLIFVDEDLNDELEEGELDPNVDDNIASKVTCLPNVDIDETSDHKTDYTVEDEMETFSEVSENVEFCFDDITEGKVQSEKVNAEVEVQIKKEVNEGIAEQSEEQDISDLFTSVLEKCIKSINKMESSSVQSLQPDVAANSTIKEIDFDSNAPEESPKEIECKKCDVESNPLSIGYISKNHSVHCKSSDRTAEISPAIKIEVSSPPSISEPLEQSALVKVEPEESLPESGNNQDERQLGHGKFLPKLKFRVPSSRSSSICSSSSGKLNNFNHIPGSIIDSASKKIPSQSPVDAMTEKIWENVNDICSSDYDRFGNRKVKNWKQDNKPAVQPAYSSKPCKYVISSPAPLYYEKIYPEVVATDTLLDLHDRFQLELIDRATGVRATQVPYNPPPRKAKLRNHKIVCSEDHSDSDSSEEESSSDEEDTSIKELEKKRLHPYRLHPELWNNDVSEMNDGPLCRCSAKSRRAGIRHGIYIGEERLMKCDPLSNNFEKIHHYKITITPITNFKTDTPTVIVYKGYDYVFEGFSILSHVPLSPTIPACRVIRFNYEYSVRHVEEPMPDNFTVGDCELFSRFLMLEILELLDLDWKAYGDTEGCPRFHILPRFTRALRGDGKEFLSMSAVLEYLLNSNEILDNLDMSLAYNNPKGDIVTCPGMKPSSIRVDQLDVEMSESDPTPKQVIVHFGVRPPQLSYAGNPMYQKAWREYVKYRHLLANKPRVNDIDKGRLAHKEMNLQKMRMESDLKRDVTIVVSSKGFYKTGLKSDVVQHAMLLPVLVCHLRFHQSLAKLEEIMGYKFKDRFLLQLALTHPSYRENFGTNPDHARNSLTNCGLRQPQYGDRRIHYMNTRKRGINTLINIMSRFGKNVESASNINHNERLEFLGDAVVEFMSSVHLFHMFPDLEEGGLATYRAAIVQNQHLALLSKKLQLEKFMLYAHGSDLCHDLELRHAMANCYEALMGALFLDGGIEVADKVFSKSLFNTKELLEVWMNFPLHPLQEQEPGSDRRWIDSVPLLKKINEFEKMTGIEFNHIRLLARALTHRSMGYNNLTCGSNQRLEFLGDTVLQLVASEYLYKFFPQHHEGHLSLLRSSLVNNRTQAVVCEDLGMANFAIFPHTKVELKPKDKADLLEAFLGALYVDKDLSYCKVFCEVCFFPRLQDFIMNQDWNDPKSKLQQCCLTLRSMDGGEPDIPQYKVIECKGPTNTRVYKVAVYFQGHRLDCGIGHSIQQAEMDAADNALKKSKDLFPQLKHQKRAIERSLKRGTAKTTSKAKSPKSTASQKSHSSPKDGVTKRRHSTIPSAKTPAKSKKIVSSTNSMLTKKQSRLCRKREIRFVPSSEPLSSEEFNFFNQGQSTATSFSTNYSIDKHKPSWRKTSTSNKTGHHRKSSASYKLSPRKTSASNELSPRKTPDSIKSNTHKKSPASNKSSPHGMSPVSNKSSPNKKSSHSKHSKSSTRKHLPDCHKSQHRKDSSHSTSTGSSASKHRHSKSNSQKKSHHTRSIFSMRRKLPLAYRMDRSPQSGRKHHRSHPSRSPNESYSPDIPSLGYESSSARDTSKLNQTRTRKLQRSHPSSSPNESHSPDKSLTYESSSARETSKLNKKAACESSSELQIPDENLIQSPKSVPAGKLVSRAARKSPSSSQVPTRLPNFTSPKKWYPAYYKSRFKLFSAKTKGKKMYSLPKQNHCRNSI